MSFFPKAPLIVGIELTTHSFKIAIIKKRRKGWEVERLEEFSLDVNLLDKLPKEAHIVTALPTREVLARPLEIPLKKEKDIDSAYEFQAEPLLPFPLEKALLQKIKIKTLKESTLLTLLATKKDHYERHLKFFRERGLDPLCVTALPLALAELATKEEGAASEAELVLHMSKEEGSVALIEEGKLLSARAFEKEKSEIERSILSILSNHKSKKIQTLRIIAEDPLDHQLVLQSTTLNVTTPKLLDVTPEALQKYGIALGLAFAAAHGNAPNFLEKENNFALHWKRAKKPLLTYFALAAALFVTAFSFERKLLEDQEKRILLKSSLLFQSMPNSLDELMAKLAIREREIQKIPDTFPLLPQIPKVKDLLAWLSSDSRFLKGDGKCAIVIEEFRYVMVSRPDFDRRNDKYLVKVELVFTAASPESAHAFRESLLSQNNPFCDGKREVEWVAGNGKYQASFYLKDKTRYG